MTRARIAIFEGVGRSPMPRRRPRMYGYGYGYGPRMGAPLLNNPRPSQYAGQYGDAYGRRSYYVPSRYKNTSYGPETEGGQRSGRLVQKGYKVKKARNSKWQKTFKRAAKTCSRRRNKKSVTFQECMAKKLGKRRRKK